MLYKDFVREKTHHLTKIKSAEGYPCVFDKSKGKALKDYKVYGKSIQNGTPTPETPVEIESVGDLTTKNLLNVKEYFSDFLDANGNLVYNQSNFNTIYNKFLLTSKFKENTRYTLSCTVEISNADNNGIAFAFYGSGNIILSQFRCVTTGSKTFNVKLTNNANTTIKYVRIAYTTSSRICDVKISNLQIEEGATATEYEPYGKYKIPVAIVGKNVLNINEKRTILTGKLPTDNYSVEDGIMSFQTQFYAIANNKFGIKFNVKPNTSYSVRYTLITGRAYITIYNMDGQAITTSNSMSGFRFNNGNNTELVFQMRSNSWDELVQMSDIMIRETDTTTSDYVSYYDGLTITNIFLDAPLRKHDTYADYIDFKRQKVVRRVGYFKRSADTLKSLTNSVIAYATSKPNAMSWYSRSTIGPSSAKYGYTGAFHWYVNPDSGNMFLFSPAEDMTLGEYFTNLNIQTDVEFIWATSKTTEEAITLPPILTQTDYNIITTTTTVTPSNIEVKYVAK